MSDNTQHNEYNHAAIEPRWQKFWQENNTFRADDNATDKPKYYVLDMFPYPSGAGLHIGHPEGYTGSDILARYKKARGFNVLHPMGWDAFGLPAEQYAIQTGEHPAVQTGKNIENFRRQLQMLGFAIDWNREISTTDPHYFKWTQWIFLQLFKAGLAYVDEKPVWFCPELGTVLANEEVLNTEAGPRSERGNHPVERRPIRQWVLRITAYAEKLIAGLDALDWPDSTKRLQKNWIGRSEGAEVDFVIADGAAAGEKLTVYTTRPDTLFGATYMVVAPEHPLVEKLTSPAQRAEVEKYIAQVRNKSDLERTDLAKDKSGVFSGTCATNPVNGEKIPVWIADYVLMGYGTGAIMAVPAHDQRDWEFAKKFGIKIIPVVNAPAGVNVDLEKSAFEADGTMTNSGAFDGLPVDDAKKKITAMLADKKQGKSAVNYKLRDWLFSRQRYWGEPFPILWVSPADYAKIPATSPLREFLPAQPVTCKIDGADVCAVPLTTKDLPLQLPKVESYKPSPTGESPLARATDWLNVFVNLETGETKKCSVSSVQSSENKNLEPENLKLETPWVAATRETNTMPQWAGSCWYHLRYLDPQNLEKIVSPEKMAYWGTPDFYIGGAEHAVLHLLYARFWHRFLFDIGVLPDAEPYKKLFHQGIILGEDGEKMSKSRGNVVNPDSIVEKHGTDALRMYLMFLGPLEAVKPWNTKNIEGISRFLRRVWRVFGAVSTDAKDSPELERVLHQTIKKVTDDIENLRFNTAISQLMIFLNAAEKAEKLSFAAGKAFLQMLAPLAPHIAEELWSKISGGTAGSISETGWPTFDETKLVEDNATIVFQVNGKLRGQAILAKTAGKDEMLAAAKADESVQRHIAGKEIVKEIIVPGKLVNIVVKG